MNWYKKAQHSNLPSGYTFPSDEDESYFSGDDYSDIKKKKEERRRKEYRGVEDGIKRNERWRKAYPHMDEVEKLQEQLNNPNIGEIEKKKIKKRIGVHNAAISKIFNAVGTLTDVSF